MESLSRVDGACSPTGDQHDEDDGDGGHGEDDGEDNDGENDEKKNNFDVVVNELVRSRKLHVGHNIVSQSPTDCWVFYLN